MPRWMPAEWLTGDRVREEQHRDDEQHARQIRQRKHLASTESLEANPLRVVGKGWLTYQVARHGTDAGEATQHLHTKEPLSTQ
jgi:hypothetical protein